MTTCLLETPDLRAPLRIALEFAVALGALGPALALVRLFCARCPPDLATS